MSSRDQIEIALTLILQSNILQISIMHSQPSIGTTEMFEISEIPQKIILKIKVTEHANRTIAQHLKQLVFHDVTNKGKYSSLQFSYNREQNFITVAINKYYYLNVLNMKKYQVLLFSRSYQTNFEEFMTLYHQILLKFIKPSESKIIDYDAFSITIVKDFRFLNWKNQEETKRLFLKMSPFYFRRNPYVRTKECEQYFAVILKPLTNPQQPPSLPTDEQFFKSPRVSFIDDVYSNDSFVKRFAPRFLLFYHAHSLFVGEAPIQHRYVKQFYMKCASKCSMNTLRLKKISFNFRLPFVETNKKYKLVLFLYCIEEEREQGSGRMQRMQQPFLKTFKQKITNFTIEMMIEQQQTQKQQQQLQQQQQQQSNSQNLQQMFLKHLIESLSIPQEYPFVQLGVGQNRSFKVYNEVGFAWILCMLCFFIDRLTFKNVSPKVYTDSSSNNCKDPIMFYKLPATEQYKLKKYAYNYCVQIKSVYIYGLINNNPVKEQDRLKSPYQASLNRIIMLRKKVAKDMTQNFQFAFGNDNLRGLVTYVGQLLRKFNAIDCYHDINCFVANYMNIIVDKNKEKNEKTFYKNVGQWKQVLDGLSALVEAITRTLCSADRTVVLHILRTYEDSRRNQELTKMEINENEEVMLMTFKYLQITPGGWVEIIPSCMYYFEMQRDQTYLYIEGETKREEIGIKFRKDQIEKNLRSYLNRTLKFKLNYPPLGFKYGQK